MATRIQARIRGVIGRTKALQRGAEIDEELKDEALHELQQEAIIKIQSRARGALVRKKMPVSDKERRQRRRRRSQLRNSLSPSRFSDEEQCVEQMGVYADPDDVGEWPKELDLELLDDWQELNQPANASGDTVTESQFLSVGRLRVFCGTWNMHAKKPTDDLRLWIRLNKYHIVAVGSEECVNSIAKSVVFTSKKSWEDQLRSTLGDDYILVAAHALTAIHNIVFVHNSLLPLLGNIQSDAVATGLGNQLGNKGGVGVAFTIGGTSFAFINSHFEAHQRNVSKRNGNFHRINHELRLSPTGAISSPTASVSISSSPTKGETLNGLGRTSANRFSMPTVTVGGTGGTKRTISDRFDRVFWYGDLNYRINGTRRMVDTLLLRNQYEVLYANDQLQREMKAGNVFGHFREGQLHFRPTYKFDKRSDTYDSSSKQRIPSWTDRVLYLSNDKVQDVELLSYRSQTDFRTSDHRPVCAIFQVNFKSTGTVDFLQSPRPSANENGLPDENRAISQACTVQ
ncbi:inositol polyphosphate 5-phosphatase [Phytophthora citrophthora]|uniref:Inositol polyphosphate 5-phosphatase n=1 Tax=Phytophthora citrophthora TaxID=4793 RepID=A0AAD9LPP3_9STRA|nr:inositol polyphosphate 5-phosphatase [Phytophthora citrophthora]